MKFEWEQISFRGRAIDGNTKKSWRAKVFGGWVVNSTGWIKDDLDREGIAESTVFIPDANHEWVIDE